jgi:hypothetical protein
MIFRSTRFASMVLNAVLALPRTSRSKRACRGPWAGTLTGPIHCNLGGSERWPEGIATGPIR